MTENPFKVYSPEDMSAEQVAKLYVPVAEKLEIDGPEHVFLHGHRGCGKSMMFRLMTPDCQVILEKKRLSELPYLGVYATIKTTGLDVIEYERLKNQYAGLVLAEHSLVSFLGSKLFLSLKDNCLPAIEDKDNDEELKEFIERSVLRRLRAAGADAKSVAEQVKMASTKKEAFTAVSCGLDAAYGVCSDYLRRSSFISEYRPYEGPLLGYRDFLFPLLQELSQLSFMPVGRPVYFLLDDADNLNHLQTQVLNTWVSFRTGNRVAFKISTQLSYKTYLTISRQRIEAPHDYREIHISSIHTGSTTSSNYPKWVSSIVEKRLTDHDIHVTASEFFPEDAEQEARIKEFGDKRKTLWETDPRGYRPSDDAYRYARADYIKSLGGTTKQTSNYRYAGFGQLVHISSGIIRYFLDNATQMYAEQEVKNGNRVRNRDIPTVSHIDPTIQDEVCRTAADTLMFGNFDQLEQGAVDGSAPKEIKEFKKLRNLIRGLGGIFAAILDSDRSERRVFSIALSDDPPEDIMEVLRLGVKHGYFYEASIGTKDGSWRTRRYVMTRRLAPHFNLDPMGFSGYLFVTTELLLEAITNPQRAVRKFVENRLGTVLDATQLPLEF